VTKGKTITRHGVAASATAYAACHSHAENEEYQEYDEENEEQEFGDGERSAGDPGKTKDTGNEAKDQKEHGQAEHVWGFSEVEN
jgi:hypothetical protein